MLKCKHFDFSKRFFHRFGIVSNDDWRLPLAGRTTTVLHALFILSLSLSLKFSLSIMRIARLDILKALSSHLYLKPLKPFFGDDTCLFLSLNGFCCASRLLGGL